MKQVGQMTWSPTGGSSVGVLYLRMSAVDPWKPYTEFPNHNKPDLPSSSDGYATFLSLIQKKWEYIR
ncbi:hypothetical protein Lepto7376_3173 [[Leptolyngbya] sp. PCC 7376]|uniref:hypothetical protein n=1 Tax=[Leptolyngbya] sp. PCC 7376 TaxID=111781 RepID=UPI00029EC847|nr:hypothetical protein [[Leptolyngbya] sp. PCC 7376]AFY39402.1 hypothetical protein Lepto7376_3173 [[Leptolyngbya] sp. PCC 7376]